MKRIVVLFLALALLLGMATAVSAQAGTWVSGIYIKNLDTTHSNEVTVAFYWAEGYGDTSTPVATKTYTLTADGTGASSAVSIYVPNVTELPENFVGSAVVTAQYAVAANLNTQLPPTTTGDSASNPVRVGTSTGVLDPDDTLYFTQVMKEVGSDSVGYFNSYIAVQNTSATNAATITVKYYNFSDGAEVVAARETGLTIAANSTRIIRQSENANLPTMWQGTCVVTGDQPLAGIANFYNSGATEDTKSQFNSYNAFTAGGTTLYIPRASRNLADYQGAISVMNVGGSTANVTIEYKFGGTTYTQNVTGLAPFAGKSIYLANVTELSGVNGTGSAKITSTQPVVATVNEDNRVGVTPAGHGGRSITYSGFVDGVQTTTMVFPQVTARLSGYNSGVQVQNVSNAEANVTFTFSGGTQDYSASYTLAAGESKSVFVPDIVTQSNFNGSCVVTSDQPIVGIANTSIWWGSGLGDVQKYGDSYLCSKGVNK